MVFEIVRLLQAGLGRHLVLISCIRASRQAFAGPASWRVTDDSEVSQLASPVKCLMAHSITVEESAPATNPRVTAYCLLMVYAGQFQVRAPRRPKTLSLIQGLFPTLIVGCLRIRLHFSGYFRQYVQVTPQIVSEWPTIGSEPDAGTSLQGGSHPRARIVNCTTML